MPWEHRGGVTLRFAVAVKQVPDTMEMSVDENGSLVRAGVPTILNPYDEYALARVLEMKEEGDEVVVFTMGPPQAESALRKCLELGADKAYLLTDRTFAGADVWATARTLTAFILKFIPDADLYVFGRQAIASSHTSRAWRGLGIRSPPFRTMAMSGGPSSSQGDRWCHSPTSIRTASYPASRII